MRRLCRWIVWNLHGRKRVSLAQFIEAHRDQEGHFIQHYHRTCPICPTYRIEFPKLNQTELEKARAEFTKTLKEP